MLKKIANTVTNNLSWKILSILFAFLFWWAVVSYDDPIKEETFRNVPVNKINVESISDKFFAVEYLEGEYVDIRISAKKSVIDRLTLNDINAFVDVSNLSITNAIDIEVEIDGEYQSFDVNPANMKVRIEEIVTVSKVVQYLFEGEPAENYIALDPVITPSVIQVTGPESQVALVSSVIVSIPIDNAKKDITLFYSPEILDSKNSPVSKVKANIAEVGIVVPVQLTKTIDVKFRPLDTVPEGFELVDVSLDKSSVVVRGSEAALERIEEIVINDISLSELTEDYAKSIYLEDYLPESVNIYGFDTNVNLTIDVEEIIEKEIEITHQDIDVKNLPEGLIFSFKGEEGIVLVIKGIPDKLDKVTLDSLDPYVKLLDLEAGEHSVAVSYYIPFGVELVSEEQSVEIILTEDETLNDEPNNEADNNTNN